MSRLEIINSRVNLINLDLEKNQQYGFVTSIFRMKKCHPDDNQNYDFFQMATINIHFKNVLTLFISKNPQKLGFYTCGLSVKNLI